MEVKWYQKTTSIIVLLILFFPAGLYLMWKYAKWGKAVKGIITGVFTLVLLAGISGDKKQTVNTVVNPSPQPTAQAQKTISYEIVKRWSIPNGGEGKLIVISPDLLNEADMLALGEKLKLDTKSDRNADISVYTDKKAAEMRDRLSSETNKLTKEEDDFYNTHFVAQYNRNINTGYHEYTIYFDGVMGTNKKTIKY